MMQKINQLLSRYLKPSQITIVYMVVSFLLIVGFVMLVSESRTPQKPKFVKKPDIENIITSKNTRNFGLDAVNDKVTVTSQDVTKLEKMVTGMAQKLKDAQEGKKSSEQLARELKQTKATVSKLEAQIANQKQEIDDRVKKAVDYQMSEVRVQNILTAQPIGSNSSASNQRPLPKVNPQRRQSRDTNFSYGNKGNSGATTQVSGQQVQGSMQTASASNKPVIPTEPEQRTRELFTVIEEEHAIAYEESDEIYLPKGSILTGVLITGFDAPTQSNASDNPMPVLVRVKKEAILPNHYVLEEVRECFALLAGYGDLSSERAQLRGEAITCVKGDGEVLEKTFGSYAVGEDGKAGLKGTLVTRNSAILVRTMMAGFMSGMASAFDVTPVPVIATESDGTQQYQDVWSADAVQGGVASGASQGLEKLADYYMDLADQMHPVIEIGSGRVIDMIITQGTTL
jgi:conjugal transfer pilus assembly protein TraB